MKKIIILVAAFAGFWSCKPFLDSARLAEENKLNLVFTPRKSHMEMDIPNQSKLKTPAIKDDMYVVLSEDINRILIYPFYKSSPDVGPMGFKLATALKDKSGYMAAIYDDHNERIGYVWLYNKTQLNVSINLEKKKTFLKISFDCSREDEVNDLNAYDKFMIVNF